VLVVPPEGDLQYLVKLRHCAIVAHQSRLQLIGLMPRITSRS
jgi:hypothetical protein